MKDYSRLPLPLDMPDRNDAKRVWEALVRQQGVPATRDDLANALLMDKRRLGYLVALLCEWGFPVCHVTPAERPTTREGGYYIGNAADLERSAADIESRIVALARRLGGTYRALELPFMVGWRYTRGYSLVEAVAVALNTTPRQRTARDATQATAPKTVSLFAGVAVMDERTSHG